MAGAVFPPGNESFVLNAPEAMPPNVPTAISSVTRIFIWFISRGSRISRFQLRFCRLKNRRTEFGFMSSHLVLNFTTNKKPSGLLTVRLALIVILLVREDEFIRLLIAGCSRGWMDLLIAIVQRTAIMNVGGVTINCVAR